MEISGRETQRCPATSQDSKMQRVFFAALLAVALFPTCLLAGAIREWHITDLEHAPVLVVGRVDVVGNEFQLARDNKTQEPETWAMTSQVEVLRSYSSSGEEALEPGRSITVRFRKYAHLTMSANGTPPPLVHLAVGDVLL